MVLGKIGFKESMPFMILNRLEILTLWKQIWNCCLLSTKNRGPPNPSDYDEDLQLLLPAKKQQIEPRPAWRLECVLVEEQQAQILQGDSF